MPPLPLPLTLEHADNAVESLRDEFHLSDSETDSARTLVAVALPPIVRPEILAFLFGISYSLILSITHNSSLYYRVSRRLRILTEMDERDLSPRMVNRKCICSSTNLPSSTSSSNIASRLTYSITVALYGNCD